MESSQCPRKAQGSIGDFSTRWTVHEARALGALRTTRALLRAPIASSAHCRLSASLVPLARPTSQHGFRQLRQRDHRRRRARGASGQPDSLARSRCWHAAQPGQDQNAVGRSAGGQAGRSAVRCGSSDPQQSQRQWERRSSSPRVNLSPHFSFFLFLIHAPVSLFASTSSPRATPASASRRCSGCSQL